MKNQESESHSLNKIIAVVVGTGLFGILYTIFSELGWHNPKIWSLYFGLVAVEIVITRSYYKPGEKKEWSIGLCTLIIIFQIPIFATWSSEGPSTAFQRQEIPVNAELDDPIRRVVLRFWLTDTMLFDSLRPIRGKVMINPANSALFEGLVFQFRDANSRTIPGTPNNDGLVCYKIELMRKEETVHEQTFAVSLEEIFRIGLPVPVWADSEGPFKTLRDFHRAQISYSISTHLIQNIERIELIVNGWEIVRKDLAESQWRNDGETSTLISEPGSTEYPPRAIFDILVRDRPLTFHENFAGPVPTGEAMTAIYERVVD